MLISFVIGSWIYMTWDMYRDYQTVVDHLVKQTSIKAENRLAINSIIVLSIFLSPIYYVLCAAIFILGVVLATINYLSAKISCK